MKLEEALSKFALAKETIGCDYNLLIVNSIEKRNELYEIAISAIQKQIDNVWTTCSERLPRDIRTIKDGEEYYPFLLVTLEDGDVCLGVYRQEEQEWWTRHSEGEEHYVPTNKVIAWMPLPEQYINVKALGRKVIK